jgi:hypothetical protein
MANPSMDARWARVMHLLVPKEAVERARRVDQTITQDARVDVSRATGLLAPESRPTIDADEVFADGFDADSLQELLESIAGDQIDATRIADGSVSNTEFQYLNGVTSALQTQLDAKSPTASPTISGTILLGTGASDIVQLRGHVKHRGTAPSIAVGAALGTGGSVGASISGTAQVGELFVTAGTTSLVAGTAATITFPSARPDTNYSVQITPRASTPGANAVGAYATRNTVNDWLLRFASAPSSGLQYAYAFVVMEWTN